MIFIYPKFRQTVCRKLAANCFPHMDSIRAVRKQTNKSKKNTSIRQILTGFKTKNKGIMSNDIKMERRTCKFYLNIKYCI